MIIELLRQLNHGVLVGALALMCVLCGALAWHVVTYLRLRRKGLVKEAELLSHILPPEAQLPHVLVQIPTFNEGSVIRRVTEAVGGLDWPREKLHIQVLDDSTDGSLDVAREAVAALRLRGLDAVLLHRKDRRGFKAAALQAGLQQSDHEYVACFDADFVPSRDFLRQCLRVLLADPELAFVQARWEALNANENALTRAQLRMIDAFFGIHQTARTWSGHLVIFDGTCAVWRRAAIDELGGWQGDIFMEDIDISYRALLRGRRGRCLVTVAVPGELPHSTTAWQRQQYRWNSGLAQAMRKYLPAIWCSRLTVARKLISSSYLANSVFGALLGIIAVAAMLELLLGAGPSLLVRALGLAACLEFAVAAAAMPLSQRLLRGADPWSDLPHTLASISVLLYTQLVLAFSALHLLGGKGPGWTPTPKTGVQRSSHASVQSLSD